METQNEEFKICSNCGSREFLENYPSPGKEICAKCGHEITKIKLKIIKTEQQIADQCPFCGKEKEHDDIFFEMGIITIFKCKGCGKLDSYVCYSVVDLDHIDDRSYDPKSVKIAQQEGTTIYTSHKIEKLKKSLKQKKKDPVEKCKKQLNNLIHNHIRELNSNSISFDTIRSARWKVESFLEKKGPITRKNLNSIFPAALFIILVLVNLP